MIPSILARQLEQGVKDFLATSFPVSTPFFSGIIEKLLQEKSIFKGPYLSIDLPFLKAGETDFFPDVPLAFRPYRHQQQAFQRLSGKAPRSSIIATGTGSGKTECFLYPILDHCFRHRGEAGIKAILIYPMNALAADQAGRIARIIWNNQKLKGQVTAGLFVGQSEREPRMVMGPDGIITNKDTQRISPPDILLTNYKMLDYLLVRPKDLPLWSGNQPETLRYLIVDEIHTFDGAQGTDLACLIRRLKARLATPERHLCCVGTSATLGDRSDSSELIDYASRIFGEPFDENAVIGESRKSAGEFLENSLVSYVQVPSAEKRSRLNPESYGELAEFIKAQHELWFQEKIENFERPEWLVRLSSLLKEHLFFQNLLKVLAGKPRSYELILKDLARVTPEFRETSVDYQVAALNSLLSLVSVARTGLKTSEQETAPFLNVRIHLWLRELRRMVGEISVAPALKFADDLTDDQLQRHSAMVHCRDCGSMGWAGTKPAHETRITTDLQSFYTGFFGNGRKVIFLFPQDTDPHKEGLDGAIHFLCVNCHHLNLNETSGKCPACGLKELVRVFVPAIHANSKGKVYGLRDCPYCGASAGLTIVGFRAATLTSVLVGQLFSSGFNRDKKLLTFSDSVQDAAHRAGFFGARTYRFTLRTALQKFVLSQSAELSLQQFPDRFRRFWSDRMDEPRYLCTFLAPNMAWYQDYERLKREGTIEPRSLLRRDVDQRVEWEILAEYGFRARIGRTLEKTSSSIAFPDPELLSKVRGKLLETIQNEIGTLRSLDQETLNRFLAGILTQLKNRGGIEFSILEKYIRSLGNTYLIKLVDWMPGFGDYTRAPAFLTTRTKRTRFDAVVASGSGRRSWYQAWAEKCFHRFDPMIAAMTPQLLELTLKALVAGRVLREWTVQHDKIWGLRPEALRVTSAVLQFRCQRCSHNASASASEEELWEGAPCLRYHCDGIYQKQPEAADYYGKLYASGDVERIFTDEHTGLLQRDQREALERQFKAPPQERRPWFPNLLSCTPTLEMGIDIGDLSSVVLCSVPPSRSNYLQRVGRAGRRDGNSLGLTVSNARPHDLFFYGEPMEMLAGKVETPDVFLNASAVLERQLTAFCLDRWVESGVKPTELPDRLGVVLGNLDPVDYRRFPYNFLRFIENRQSTLFEEFIRIFAGEFNEETVQHLKAFFDGNRDEEGSLVYKIIEGLHSRKKQRDSLRRQIRVLTERIRRLQQDPAKDKKYPETMQKYRGEKEALQALSRSITDKNTYNFFTDEGLLPNYAFPEAGVLLRSVIYRRKEKAEPGESRYDTWTYEYQRPAVAAIAELAPENNFYACGRKVAIDQIDMNVSQVQEWRLCRNCSYSELIGTNPEQASCPRCGDVMWGDSGQKRPMVLMKQVIATSDDRRSRIEDESDDREPTFYNKQILVSFEDEHIREAYRIQGDALPFGFEFLSRAVFREINFGEQGNEGDQVTIAGKELPRSGFQFCKVCGKVARKRKNGGIDHAFTCTARDQESDKNLIDCAYLFREFSSEAIRILLPVTTFSESESRLHSFIAALHLGLKKKFGGSIDHLQTTVYDEPVEESIHRKKYLVLFDSVPGGTGYLKQLTRSGMEMLEVLQLSLDTMRSCACALDPQKDGCYRCLFAYRNSYHMEETSRTTAVDLLANILKQKETLLRIDSLSKVPVNSLFDSELEARFVEALLRSGRQHRAVQLSKALVNGKPGYLLKVADTTWYVEPQVKLGKADGVAISSQADFVIRPARTDAGLLPIAVFTDGLLYHRNRIGQDMAQRMAIAATGRFHVWSLTWNDVDNRFSAKPGYFWNFTNPASAPNGATFTAMLEGFEVEEFDKAHQEDSFEWLLRFLAHPDRKRWTTYAFIHGLMRLEPDRFRELTSIEQWKKETIAQLSQEWQERVQDIEGDCLYGRLAPAESTETRIQISVVIPKAAVSPADPSQMGFFCWLDDSPEAMNRPDFEKTWNGYLRLYNLFQFLPLTFFATRKGLEGNLFDLLPEPKESQLEVTVKGESAGWQEARELAAEVAHPLLDRLAEAGWEAPEVGYELVGDGDGIVASAELAWQGLKIALTNDGEMETAEEFFKAGWKVIPLAKAIQDVESLLAQRDG